MGLKKIKVDVILNGGYPRSEGSVLRFFPAERDHALLWRL